MPAKGNRKELQGLLLIKKLLFYFSSAKILLHKKSAVKIFFMPSFLHWRVVYLII